MQHLDNLWKAVNLVSSARDLAIENKTYQWDIQSPITFFLQIEYADVFIKRHEQDQIVATVELQAGFGWQITTDQDHAGVYIIGRRKPVIGSLGRARLDIALPYNIHITLKLEHCQLTLDNLSTSLEFPPIQNDI